MKVFGNKTAGCIFVAFPQDAGMLAVNLKLYFMYKLLSIAAFSAILHFGCSSSSSKPEKIEDIGGGVIAINPSNFSAPPNWMIIDIKSYGDANSLAFDAEKIVKDIKQYFPTYLDKYDKIWIFGNVEFIDNYGNKTTERTFGIEWPTAELKKINYEQNSFNVFGLLNLATDIRGFNRNGHEAFLEYCSEEDHAKYANNFCLLVASEYAR